MNVQDVIERALANPSTDGIPVAPVEHSSCEDVQVEKLASALNFIGANLESSVYELEKVAKEKKDTRRRDTAIGASALGLGGLTAATGGNLARRAHGDIQASNRISKIFNQIPTDDLGFGDALREGLGDLRDEAVSHSKKQRLVGAGGALGGLALAGYGAKKLYDARKRPKQEKKASADDILYEAARAGKEALLTNEAGNALLDYGPSVAIGALGAHNARKEMREAGMSEKDIDSVLTRKGGAARGLGKMLGGTVAGGSVGGILGLAGGAAAKKMGLKINPESIGLGSTIAGAVGGNLYGTYRGYKGEVEKGRSAIKARGLQKKTASANDVLYHAAQAGKQALLEKVAEDRINPAQISAGPADPYSGEIMPNAGQVSNEFVGNTRDHHALIALKAQKVRDRINKDMKQYVSNVGDGYNLQGHLNKMNK